MTILDINEQAGHHRPEKLTTDMHFREQYYGYFEGLDMGMAWHAAGAPHGAPSYNAIVRQYGPGATRDFLKEAFDPFHDAESDAEYWTRVEGDGLPRRIPTCVTGTMCWSSATATHCSA